METSSSVVIVLVAILGAIILFSLLKGVIKMLLLAIAAISAIAAWIFIQRNGFTYLSLVTGSPQPWMVQVCAWGVSIFIFSVFFHGMNWFSQLFSWRRDGASTGGILTTAIMCALMIWLAMVGIAFYGDVSYVGYYHDLAQSRLQGKDDPDVPLFVRVKKALRRAPATSWLTKIDPLDDEAQAKLARLVAYGCSLGEEQIQDFYEKSLKNCGVPHPSRFLDLFRDKGLRTLVEERHFTSLLGNERLKTFLQRGNTQDIIVKLME